MNPKLLRSFNCAFSSNIALSDSDSEDMLMKECKEKDGLLLVKVTSTDWWKKMQVHLNPKNIFTLAMTVGFIYLTYLIFFGTNDGFPEIDIELKDIISYAVLAVEMGGQAVYQIHNEKNLNIHQKGLTDEGKAELLTQADLVSNYLILDVLNRFPRLNIITEEKNSIITEAEAEKYRTDRYSLWLNVRDTINKIPERRLPLSDIQVYVDPLDATQEYTEDLTQYVTVMVCVTLKDEPIFGAIYRPFYNETIFGVKDWGVMSADGKRVELKSAEETSKLIVVSRSHAGAVEELVRKAFDDGYTVESAGGSGYKTLRVLNGTAEFYIHKTAIKKWDTCAGDAIIRAVGGAMLDLEGEKLKYGPQSDVLNKKGLFVAARHPYTSFKKIQPSIDLKH